MKRERRKQGSGEKETGEKGKLERTKGKRKEEKGVMEYEKKKRRIKKGKEE